jgi:S-adenosylmethionine:tRNA ribosyltransferase-isomerase
MRVSDFDYELPGELVAQYPAEKRDESRLIVLNRATGEVRETRFNRFPRYLQEGDVLVINETKVIPARIFARRRTGGKVEIFLTRRLSGGTWAALLRPAGRLRTGETVVVGDSEEGIVIGERLERGEWKVSLPSSFPEESFIRRFGHVPLPPYIKRADEPADRVRYQTIFARQEGSVAAPTAGLHFTESLMHDLKRKGITVVPLTLHVGPGTFQPLADETVEGNTLPPEFMFIRQDYWTELKSAKALGRRIIAVGTTATRALESLAAHRLKARAERELDGNMCITGWTELFIYPGFDFRIVDAMLTNLHLPGSSLLVLAAAFAGRELLLKSYRWAVKRRFRFYSYGDVMFIR